MLKHTTTTKHELAAIHHSLALQGYYLANSGQSCSMAVLNSLVDALGGIWQQGAALEIAPLENARFIAQTTEAIPPHNECAYTAQPPRYLLLYCRENTVSGGDFYLVDSAAIIADFSESIISLLYHSHFDCFIDAANPQQVSLLKQRADGFYLQYSCIGHSEDWQGNHSYAPVAPLYPGYEQIIPFLQQHLRQETLRQHHVWQSGDLLIFDNQRYLHGRKAFSGSGRYLDHIRIA